MLFHKLCASDVNNVVVEVYWQGVNMSAASQLQMKLMHHPLSFSEPIIWGYTPGYQVNGTCTMQCVDW